ncbi:MAG: HAAS signaling domain-containing protein [Gaiellales bacterium]
MTASTVHPLTEEWLDRLRAAARVLPASERAELVSDIESHLAESIPPGASEAEVRDALDRLGDPEEIVAEAAGPPAPAAGRGGLEWSAIILLLVGGFLFLVGWIVGVALLWSSKAWTVKDKLIGTFLLPGGLALSYGLVAFSALGATQVCTQVTPPTPAGSTQGALTTAQGQVCHGGVSGSVQLLLLAGLVASIVLPIMTAVYLARRADRPRPA